MIFRCELHQERINDPDDLDFFSSLQRRRKCESAGSMVTFVSSFCTVFVVRQGGFFVPCEIENGNIMSRYGL